MLGLQTYTPCLPSSQEDLIGWLWLVLPCLQVAVFGGKADGLHAILVETSGHQCTSRPSANTGSQPPTFSLPVTCRRNSGTGKQVCLDLDSLMWGFIRVVLRCIKINSGETLWVGYFMTGHWLLRTVSNSSPACWKHSGCSYHQATVQIKGLKHKKKNPKQSNCEVKMVLIYMQTSHALTPLIWAEWGLQCGW